MRCVRRETGLGSQKIYFNSKLQTTCFPLQHNPPCVWRTFPSFYATPPCTPGRILPGFSAAPSSRPSWWLPHSEHFPLDDSFERDDSSQQVWSGHDAGGCPDTPACAAPSGFSSFSTIFVQIFRTSKSPAHLRLSRTVSQRLPCTICLTCSTLASVLLVEGLPFLGSSSPSLHPSLNLLCHLKTRERNIVSSLYTCCSMLSASDGFFHQKHSVGPETSGWFVALCPLLDGLKLAVYQSTWKTRNGCKELKLQLYTLLILARWRNPLMPTPIIAHTAH